MGIHFPIENRSEFNQVMKQIRAADVIAELIYDCGSTADTKGDSTKDRYRTHTFKQGCRATSIKESMSTVAIVSAPIDLSLERQVFTLSCTTGSTPFNEVPFFIWLEREDKKFNLPGIYIEDLYGFLDSIGYDRVRHKISSEQARVLRYAHQQYFYLKFNGKLAEVGSKGDEPTNGAPEKTESKTALDELALFTADGDTLHMPKEQLEYYPQIKSLLFKAGGVYKKCTFVFKGKCAATIQATLVQGEVINDKKQFQMFWTPTNLGQRAIRKLNLEPQHTWFEPSAGAGNLADLASEISPNGTLVEIHPDNIATLRDKGYDPIQADFMAFPPQQFDRIIANPPFTDNQDVDHIMKMYTDHLATGGEMVAFASQSWLIGSQKKQVAFKEFLASVGASIEKLDEEEFKESGTSVKTTMIHIQKA